MKTKTLKIWNFAKEIEKGLSVLGFRINFTKNVFICVTMRIKNIVDILDYLISIMYYWYKDITFQNKSHPTKHALSNFAG